MSASSTPLVEARPLLPREDYTVGWVCALPKELAASKAMLDQKHQRLPQPRTDRNTYKLGRIGDHNVVMACLPYGKYGTNSAANVATTMLSTFPSIRFGLMVGIGGGIPSKVRLGDVVVGRSTKTNPGVVQWDLGKDEKGGHFERTGNLASPPDEILTALSSLESEHESVGYRFQQYLDEMVVKYPMMEAKYTRSDSLKDPALSPGGLKNDRRGWRLILFTFWIVIVRVFKFLLGLQAFLSSRPMIKDGSADKEAPEAPSRTKVHYGLIASGNRVVKDSIQRDEINRQSDGEVLCLEMEAAGTLASFPCLVVRGICDYADSGKSKEWQEHAAAVAAAFTKEILMEVSVHEVSHMEYAAQICTQLNTISDNVAHLHAAKNREQHQEILDWLTPIEYASVQHDNIKRRTLGTGKWFLESDQYGAWLMTKEQTLYCPGIPGTGKTILTSIIVNDLISRFRNDSSVGIAYIYCHHRQQDNQKIDKLLLSLLRQLAEGLTPFPEIVKSLYNKHSQRRTRPLAAEISTTLQDLMKEYTRVYVLVDALDECQATDGSRAEVIRELLACQTACGVNLFMTSRIMQEVKSCITGDVIELQIRASDEDVGIYIESRFESLPLAIRANVILCEDIKTEVTIAVKGMFLLAELHMNSLQYNYTAKDARATLKRLPTGSDSLDKTYDAAMKRISSQGGSRKFAMKALSWVTCAKRPLRTYEFRHAFAIEPGESEFDPEGLPEIQDAVAVCTGLIVVDEDSDIIRLVHYTTQEYLERTQKTWFPTAEADIATSCVTYLSYDAFGDGAMGIPNRLYERLQADQLYERQCGHDLYEYAAVHWGDHARTSQITNDTLMKFLQDDALVQAAAEVLMVGFENWRLEDNPREVTGLHMASYFGLADALSALLTQMRYEDIKDTCGWTPLAWAAKQGHEDVVKLLLNSGADPESVDSDDRTPLSLAAGNGHNAVVTLLLASPEVDVDSRSKTGCSTPLYFAAAGGHGAVVKTLLNGSKADPDAENQCRDTPARIAVHRGHAHVVKEMILAKKFNCNARHAGQAPLIWAVRARHIHLVQLLLDTANAYVDLRDPSDRTPLSFAAEAGLEAIAKLLLDDGKADPNLKDENNQTPLFYAVEGGHEGLVRLLLSCRDIQVDTRSSSGSTPLLESILYGHEGIFNLLLATGKAGLNPANGFNFTPLLAAAQRGHQAIVKALLETGQVDIDVKDEAGTTALLSAAARWDEPMVKILLEHGADARVKDNEGKTPISVAGSNKDIVAILQAAIDSVDMHKKTTPPIAKDKEHDRTVLSLGLGEHHDLTASGHSGSRSWATGYDNILKSHLDTGRFDLEAKDRDGSTLFLYACKHGHTAIVQLLLATGAVDFRTRDNSGRKPLICAIEGGHESIVRLLMTPDPDPTFLSELSEETYNALPQTAAMYDPVVTSRMASSGEMESTAIPLLTVDGYEAMFRLLMAIGDFDVHLTHSSETLLWQAARNGHESLLKMLLDTGKADVNVRYSLGLTIFAIATAKGHEKVVALLLNRSDVDVNLRADSKMTPLHMAVQNSHQGIVALLLSTGKADVNATSGQGRTAIAIARANKHEAIVALLLGTGEVIMESETLQEKAE